jgi:hypothetical protein
MRSSSGQNIRRALLAHGEPDEVVTDRAAALETVIEELIPDAFHNMAQYRGHYDVGAETHHQHSRVVAAFDELTGTIWTKPAPVVNQQASRRSNNATEPSELTRQETIGGSRLSRAVSVSSKE